MERDPDVLIREIALRGGVTERAVSGILRDLSTAEFVSQARVGRRISYAE